MPQRILIVGGGIGGMCCAITLGRLGYAIDIVDIDPHWRAVGAGLTIGGAALRAFRSIGVLDEISAEGFLSTKGRFVNWAGAVISQLDLPISSDGLPGMGGILRPVLHAILARHVRAGSADVRLGITVTSLDQHADRVDATFTDGTSRSYACVLGADSLASTVRRLIFPAAPKPRFTGQGCWRLVVPKPPDILGPVFCVDGPNPTGMTPISDTQFYMYLLTHEPDNRFIPAEVQLEEMRGLLRGAGGLFGEIRERMDDTYLVNYRPLEALLVPKPWSSGRVLLVGDAAHATTPHIGFGAGLAVEDAVVLADELARDGDPAPAFERFTERRFERAKYVIETSVNLGEMEMNGRMKERMAAAAAAQVKLLEPI